MEPVVDLVAGARPNFVKLAPVQRAIAALGGHGFRIVHTGQHYDAGMNDVFFEDLAIPPPDVHLEVGSGSHGAQTARILERYEAQLLKQRPAATVVFGDVNSTVACALAAAKLGVPVVHVEAGLRSFDESMPEELNRRLTDAMSRLLFVSEPQGVENLRREGIDDSRVRLVGNVMIDTLLAQLARARGRSPAAALGLAPKSYGVVTLHRPSNVDDASTLAALVALLHELAGTLPLVFPVHPRTLESARRHGLGAPGLEAGGPRLRCIGPQPYLEMLGLTADAALVLTDSGGLQEECAVLDVPCLTLRDNTERPVTGTLGTSRLVGNDVGRIRAAFAEARAGRWAAARPIPLWDGHAGERVARELAAWLASP